MAKLMIETEKEATEKVIVEIPVPCFFRTKDEKHWLGVLDEKTLVTIYKTNGLALIKNSDITNSHDKKEILEALESYTSATETEFLEFFDQTIESISLHPILSV